MQLSVHPSHPVTLHAHPIVSNLIEPSLYVDGTIHNIPRAILLFMVGTEQIHELHSPAMRDRHWKALLEVTEDHTSQRKPSQVWTDVKRLLSPSCSHCGAQCTALKPDGLWCMYARWHGRF